MGEGELSAVEQKIVDSVRRTHALNLVNNYLLAEMVRDLADVAKNRHDYLVGMFERISARADRLPIDRQSHLTNDLFREEVSKFFAQIARGP
jgi:hypothetical protein